MATEQEFLVALVECLKMDNENKLANILRQSKITFDPQYEFSKIVSNQKKLFINIKIPPKFKIR